MDEKEIPSLKNSCEENKNLKKLLKIKGSAEEDSILINADFNSLYNDFLRKTFVAVNSITLSCEPTSTYNILSTGTDSTDNNKLPKEEGQRKKIVPKIDLRNGTDNTWLRWAELTEDDSTDEVSLENQLNEKRVSFFESKYGNRFLEIIRESVFEYGYDSIADNFFRERFLENKLAAKEWVNKMFIENFGNPEIVTGILRVIAHLSYSDIAPQGPTMALAALSHKLPEVRECGVRALENWGAEECLVILRSVSFTERWLREYTEQVISDLEESLC